VLTRQAILPMSRLWRRRADLVDWVFHTEMIVRLRLGRGTKVRQQRDPLLRVLEAVAVLLQPAVLAAFALAAWRFGVDVGWTRAFPFATGPLSHWQPWLALALALLLAVVALNRQARRTPFALSRGARAKALADRMRLSS
jgi:hypothetical protein